LVRTPSSALLGVDAVRSFGFAVGVRRCGFDVGVRDALIEHVPVELGRELGAVVGLHDLDAKRQALQDVSRETGQRSSDRSAGSLQYFARRRCLGSWPVIGALPAGRSGGTPIGSMNLTSIWSRLPGSGFS
jgi:hypothetical protein